MTQLCRDSYTSTNQWFAHLRYNTRAGFLPYDTAVLYEMEVVSITRGGDCG